MPRAARRALGTLPGAAGRRRARGQAGKRAPSASRIPRQASARQSASSSCTASVTRRRLLWLLSRAKGEAASASMAPRGIIHSINLCSARSCGAWPRAACTRAGWAASTAASSHRAAVRRGCDHVCVGHPPRRPSIDRWSIGVSHGVSRSLLTEVRASDSASDDATKFSIRRYYNMVAQD